MVLFVPALREFYLLEVPNAQTWVAVFAAIGLAAAVLHIGPKLIPWWRIGDRQQALRATCEAGSTPCGVEMAGGPGRSRRARRHRAGGCRASMVSLLP